MCASLPSGTIHDQTAREGNTKAVTGLFSILDQRMTLVLELSTTAAESLLRHLWSPLGFLEVSSSI